MIKKPPKYDTLLWAFLTLFFAFFFSAKTPVYLGLPVFLIFFVISMGLFRKFIEDWKKGE